MTQNTQLESIKLMAQVFADGEFAPEDLGKRWIDGVVRPLQEQPLKDADRAGELLDVCPHKKDGGDSHERRLTFGIVGHESGTVYGTPQLVLYGDDLNGGNDDPLWRYLAASLTCALNGPDRFNEDEKEALLSLLGRGGVHCDFCDRAFAFYEDALAHEQVCERRDNPVEITCEC